MKHFCLGIITICYAMHSAALYRVDFLTGFGAVVTLTGFAALAYLVYREVRDERRK